jgi:TldD protein
LSEDHDPREFCDGVLEFAKAAGADYADVRVVDNGTESITVRTGKVEGLGRGSSYGFGVRVIADGAWGFAASPRVNLDEARRFAEEAVHTARASALTKRRDIVIAPVDVCVGSFKTDWAVNKAGRRAIATASSLTETWRSMMMALR